MLRTAAGSLALVTLLAGCLTPKSIQATRYYTLSPAPAAQGEGASELSLGLRPLIAARPYKLEMAYRAETNRLAYFSHAEWAEMPGTMVSRAIADGISQGHLFLDTDDANNMARPDAIFFGELRQFEADYTGETPEFVVTVTASIRSKEPDVAIWADQLTIRVPLNNGLTESAAPEVAHAASEAVTQLTEEICRRIRVALQG